MSTPPVGSSKTIILLFPQHAIAIANLLFNPPDKSLTNLLFDSLNSKSFIKSLISFLISSFLQESYFNRQKISRFSSIVKSSNKILLFCGQNPKYSLKFIFPSLSRTWDPNSFLSLLIKYFILPSSASISPFNIEIKVLLPAPFCPNNAKISFS